MRHGLYAITPDEADTGKLLAAADAVLAGGAVMLQYRNKTATPTTRRVQAAALAERCRAQALPLIINDDAALAVEAGAGGAHLGAGDGDVAAARRLLGAGRVLGVSCYNRLDLADAALAAGANYVAFGSFFPSPTKPAAVRADLALIAEFKRRHPGVQVAAIGGITAANAPALIDAGADWVCVISALFDAADVAAAARRFAALFPAAENCRT